MKCITPSASVSTGSSTYDRTVCCMLHKQAGQMLTEELECRAVNDEMLFIPHMERAMPAKPLLTWDVVMPALHDGKLPDEAAETETQY